MTLNRGRDARTGVRNGRESLPGAASARKGESRSGAAISGVRRGALCPGDGTKASERSFSVANWL